MSDNETVGLSSAQIKRQQYRNVLIIGGVVLVLILIGTLYAQKEPVEKTTRTTQQRFTPITLGSQHVDDSAIWLHHAENTLQQEKKDTEDLKNQLDKMSTQQNAHITSEKTTSEKINELEQKIHTLETQLNTQQLAYPGLNRPPVAGDGTPLPPLPGAHQLPAFAKMPEPKIKHDELLLTSEPPHTGKVDKNPQHYVPAGTFVKAILLSGLDASAGVTSQSQPRPVILRLLAQGTLPNQQQSHLKNCFVTGAGFGDISSERVYIRLERLSCTRKNQQIIDIPVYGYVSGSDGKAGVRGIAVWRENALLQRSFVSGLFSGIGQSLSAMSTPPVQPNMTLNAHQLLQGGMSGGTGNALSKLADYNIRRAEQYQPIIQVSAAPVTVVFHTGFYLDEHKPDDAAAAALATASPPQNFSPTPIEKEENAHAM